MSNPECSFEEGLDRLEQLVNRMESGQMPLQESFDAYKKGMELSKALKEMLDEGDRKIELLMKDGTLKGADYEDA